MTDEIERLLDEQTEEEQERYEPPELFQGGLPKRRRRGTEADRRARREVDGGLAEAHRTITAGIEAVERAGKIAAYLGETADREADDGAEPAESRSRTAGSLERGMGRMPEAQRDLAAETIGQEAVRRSAARLAVPLADGSEETAGLPGDSPRSAGAEVRWKTRYPAEGRSVREETGAVDRLTAAEGAGHVYAAALYQRLRQTGEAAKYRGTAELTADPAPVLPRADGLSLNALDRAFQRDARRYDGGFELY